MLGFLLALSVGVLAGRSVRAQEVRVQLERGPYYLGETFEVQVIAKDFEDEPAPEVAPGRVDGGGLRFAGVSPSTSTSISIVNGKMTRLHEVTFVYRYALTGTREGTLRVPEFSVTQGATERRTRSFDVEISGVPTSDDFGLEVELPKGPIFVGQKVPIAIEFHIDRARVDDIISYQVVTPMFDVPTLRFLDEPGPENETYLEVQTEAGLLRLPASSREEVIGGRRHVVLRAERTMIALAPEDVRTDPPTAIVTVGKRYRRGLFNQRQPTASAKFMARGLPLEIEVVEVPRQGRPASFAGAVGEGFTIEVAADRSVVQLGEPIQLTLRLRGNGDLSTASLPPLDAEGLFDAALFRLPDEPPPGLVDEDGKTFEVTLRVLDASVREIPALDYSWFDAESRGFETTRSHPVALSVGAAEIVGADAVTRRQDPSTVDPSGERDPRAKGSDELDGSASATARSSSFARSGANLAVERDPVRLLRDERVERSGGPLSVALYGVGLAFFAFALVDRRRRAADPVEVLRIRTLRRARSEVDRALSGAGREEAAELGRVLRELVAALPSEAGAEFDGLIEECDALRFAPSSSPGDGDAFPPDLADRARRFVADRLKAASSPVEEA